MRAPIIKDIIRQHAEQAAFLWVVYDRHLQFPDENPDLDAIRLDRLIERLEAHLDGLREAGEDGKSIARERFVEFPEAGELFVLRMVETGTRIPIKELDATKVRTFITQKIGMNGPSVDQSSSRS